MRADKAVERDRYGKRSAAVLAGSEELPPLGAEGVPIELRRPYLRFEDWVGEAVNPDDAVLDLCCGDGQFSYVAAKAGARVTGLDLAEPSLKLAADRCPKNVDGKMEWRAGDCESLPFDDAAFDGVVCAGGFSYGEWDLVLAEVRRVLRPGGWLIAVDSFNHNPIYRLNRWLHRLRGRRTGAVNARIPSRRWLANIRERFDEVQVEYFGVFAFMAPVLRWVAGGERAARWIDSWDDYFCAPRQWAFKIVVKAN